MPCDYNKDWPQSGLSVRPFERMDCNSMAVGSLYMNATSAVA